MATGHRATTCYLVPLPPSGRHCIRGLYHRMKYAVSMCEREVAFRAAVSGAAPRRGPLPPPAPRRVTGRVTRRGRRDDGPRSVVRSFRGAAVARDADRASAGQIVKIMIISRWLPEASHGLQFEHRGLLARRRGRVRGRARAPRETRRKCARMAAVRRVRKMTSLSPCVALRTASLRNESPSEWPRCQR